MVLLINIGSKLEIEKKECDEVNWDRKVVAFEGRNK